ncbi:MAG: glycoside hydrolase N-terminal domain-containing protein [Bacteroidales bacterium]|jgi:alpha-L-fucosidase 2|nr:glycoside hydrolase N-terminal domain-containing protein [Bacteroidales bacterium]
MKNISILTAIAVLFTFHSCKNEEQIDVNQVPMSWKYDQPATKYWESLPIGTGRFGAMVPGSVDHEVIPFNDETLWTGGPYNPNNPEGPKILEKIRERAFARDWVGATKEAWQLASIPQSVQYYQAMAQLNIDYGHELAKAVNYQRSLNMDSALAKVSYQLDGVNYKRTVFASYPDQVIVIRLTADQKGKINLSNWFTSLQPTATTRAEGDEIIMEGSTISEKPNEVILPPKMKWQSKMKVIPEGGSLTVEDGKLVLTGADAATLILAGATNWVNWNDVSADANERCNKYISKSSQLTYKELLKRHTDDYCPLFSACSINLGDDPSPQATTSQRMIAISKGTFDPAYQAQYFQYARYLMLAASRENTLAFNNHNMWLNDLDGRWRGRWTLNINIQECYWCVENTNLPKLNESLVLFVENLAAAGARTAKELYGCRGWCAHHGTDVWFNTAPTDGNPLHATYPLAGMWLMQQLYDHYLYNPDPAYLQRIYPLLKGSMEFCLDFLVKDPVTGYMVTCPASSPENSFIDDKGNGVSISFGSAGDMQVVRNALRSFIEASKTLNVDEDMRALAEADLKQLPPHQIGQFGQLQEWFYDFKEAEVTHRHTMHLWAVYPDDDITIYKTPEFADAVRVVLKRRGDINMGWSGAWKINLYARLGESEPAYNILHKMCTDVSIHPSAEDSQITPSFEGNQAIQGITAGMTELLMQSHSGELSLLPALPAKWNKGAVRGLRARGGYDVDMAWNNSTLTKAVITAHYDKTCRLRSKTPVKVVSAGKTITVQPAGDQLIDFAVKAGEKYVITPLNEL